MKQSILFVDDEQSILDGFRRGLRHLRSKYDMAFVLDGKSALDFLSRNPVDVVVSDMRMPNMDGAELMKIISELYPTTVRIILSGNSDQEMVIRALKFTHQFLSKPCPVDMLETVIQRTSTLLSFVINNQEVAGFINGINSLPSLPHIFQALEQELESKTCSPERLADIIAEDPAMTAKLLQIVNSPYFGLREHMTDLKDAVIYLGIDMIKLLLLTMDIFDQHSKDSLVGLSVADIWEHSLMVGTVARRLVQRTSNQLQMSNDAFLGGLLHSVGQLVLSLRPDIYRPVVEKATATNAPLHMVEYERLGVNYAEVGAYILDLWGLPFHLVEIVAFHVHPSKVLTRQFEALSAVHFANGLLQGRRLGVDIEHNLYLDRDYAAQLQMEPSFIKWSQDETLFQKAS